VILPWRRLRRLGILGMNQRNAEFIMPYNRRHSYPLVDDKRRTKELLVKAGIAVPRLYGVVAIEHQIEGLDELIGPHEDFVIKPAHGSGGNGILVVVGCRNGRYRKSNGVLLTREELEYHVSNILSGMHSLGGVPDCALIEYRVRFDPLFEDVSYQGVPDIRTIVFRGVPVMAMVRLPTRLSDGKANLHQGAVGVGIDLGSGETKQGIWLDQVTEHHPDTGGPIRGFSIPSWDSLLALTARCHDLVGLGYLGVDIVLDRDLGPLVLEVNARPGLSIQLANKTGLLGRLRAVERLDLPASAQERAQLAREMFSATPV
jgi:alpha-L-glutamate ligase-like protein